MPPAVRVYCIMMRIYLDSKDYINLLERNQAGISVEDFREFVVGNGHTLVFSFPLICEVVAPMWEPTSLTVVSRTLNRMEAFPHEWIDILRLPNLEVRHTLASYRSQQPCDPAAIAPYVRNFVATIIGAPAVLQSYINYPLAEAVLDLRRSGSFDPRGQNERHVAGYRNVMARDREFVAGLERKTQARKELFIRRIIERIDREHLYEPSDEGNAALFNAVGEYIYHEPNRCPSSRLVFEVFHSLVDDLGDKLGDGDLGDLSQLFALPYVDRFTTDRRIAAHVERISRVLGTGYYDKIRPNVKDLMKE